MPVSLWLLLGMVLGAMACVLPRSLGLAYGLTLPGVLAHELAHWTLGWLTVSHPTQFSVFPHRDGARHWTFGSVRFEPGFFTAGLVALAPAYCLPGLAWMGWRLSAGASAAAQVALGYGISVLLASAVPSTADVRIALRYPAGTLALIAVLVAILGRYRPFWG